MVPELALRSLPLRSLHDRMVLARMAYASVADLTHVDRIGEQFVECAARESLSTGAAAVACDAELRAHPAPVELGFEQTHRAQLQVAPVDLAHGLGLCLVNHQAAFTDVVAQRHNPAHPYALTL